MYRLKLGVLVFAAVVYGGGGVTKTSGIEQFWTDDYKIFEQVYGKTSDKDLYVKLPPNIGSDIKDTQASEKKERYLQTFQRDSEEYDDSHSFGDKFNLLLTHEALKPKKEKPTFNFIGYNGFKPISQNSDPETYNYLKHLEEMENDKLSKFPIGLGGFKPYLKTEQNPEETDAYKSIQDILDAHEANKGTDDDEDSKYLTYREKGKKSKAVRNNERKPARKQSKPRCLPGRCRKRYTSSYRIRSTRPYLRRIKQRIIY